MAQFEANYPNKRAVEEEDDTHIWWLCKIHRVANTDPNEDAESNKEHRKVRERQDYQENHNKLAAYTGD